MYKLIIVDDEKEISNGFAKYFPWSQLGFQVVGQFGHAREAAAYLKEQAADLVVSDMRMPGMDGIDFARTLKEEKFASRPMLVFFSAYGEFQYARQAMKYGAVRYILKSTSYEELIEEFKQIKKELDAERKPVGENQDSDHIMSVLLKTMDEKLDSITLEELAEKVYLSPAYVSRYFKTKTGRNFQDYLIEKRMKRAAVLLQDIRYRISDISEMVGYSNPFNFTRTFKKYYKVTPSEYRQEKMGTISEESEPGR